MDGGPYGTGAFKVAQDEALTAMLEEGCRGEVWCSFRERIASDFNLPLPTTTEEDELLMATMAENLRGSAAETLKMSRWFSWMRHYRTRRRVWHSKLALLTDWEIATHRKKSTSSVEGGPIVPHQALLEARTAKPSKRKSTNCGRLASIRSLWHAS